MNPVRTKQKQSKLPWIIPIIALIATSWLVYKTISEAGIEVVVNFTDGSSLKEGKTFVKYKGFNVGKVTKITVARDLDSIDAHIRLNHDVGNILAREGTDFWLVEPRVSISEVSGLETIISGSYIEVRTSKPSIEEIEKQPKNFFFQGHSKKPLQYYAEEGINIILETLSSQNIKTGTPISYKDLEVGRVIGNKIKKNKIENYAVIYNEYKDLINSSTLFFNTSGISVKAGLQGVDVKVDSIASLLGGGISFETVDQKAKKISENTKFRLFKSYEETNLDSITIEFILESAQGLSEGSVIKYKGVEIGELDSISFHEKAITATAKIEKRYRRFLRKNSKFYRVTANINALDFTNAETIIKGSHISFVPSDGKFTNSFKLYPSFRDLEVEDMVTVKLKTSALGNLNIGSEVYFKNAPIGRVVDFDFTQNLENIIVDVAIKKRYEHILNNKTLFYIISSPLVEMENFDLQVNFEKFKPFVLGGISIEYFPSDENTTNHNYWLYNSYLELDKVKKSYLSGLRFKLAVSKDTLLSENLNITYNGVKIGFVEEFYPLSKTPYADIFIYEKYKKFVDKNSRFYTKSALKVDAEFGKIDIELSSIENILKGSIVLTNSHPKKQSLPKEFSYQLFDSLKTLTEKKGEYFTLHTDKALDLSKNAKISYKKQIIGEVEEIHLGSDATKIFVKIKVFSKYKNLIRTNSKFYLTSGVDVDLSLTGAKIKADTLQSIINGGIAVVTPEAIEDKAKENSEFTLYEEAQEEWLTYNPKIEL